MRVWGFSLWRMSLESSFSFNSSRPIWHLIIPCRKVMSSNWAFPQGSYHHHHHHQNQRRVMWKTTLPPAISYNRCKGLFRQCGAWPSKTTSLVCIMAESHLGITCVLCRSLFCYTEWPNATQHTQCVCWTEAMWTAVVGRRLKPACSSAPQGESACFLLAWRIHLTPPHSWSCDTRRAQKYTK